MDDRRPRLRRRMLLALLLLLLFLPGCKSEPIEVYRRMLASAQIGYEEGFVGGFSVRSRSVVKALLRLTDVYGFESRNPLRMLDSDDALAQDVRGDVAVVVAHRAGMERPVLFVRDEEDGGAWRVDLSEYELFLQKGPDRYLDERAKREE